MTWAAGALARMEAGSDAGDSPTGAEIVGRG
jgi:hypothetical protein